MIWCPQHTFQAMFGYWVSSAIPNTAGGSGPCMPGIPPRLCPAAGLGLSFLGQTASGWEVVLKTRLGIHACTQSLLSPGSVSNRLWQGVVLGAGVQGLLLLWVSVHGRATYLKIQAKNSRESSSVQNQPCALSDMSFFKFSEKACFLSRSNFSLGPLESQSNPLDH